MHPDLQQDWNSAAVRDTSVAHRTVERIGDALVTRLRNLASQDWSADRMTAPGRGDSEIVMTVVAEDEDGISQVNFRANFDFTAALAKVENVSVIARRGQGVGRQLFATFLETAAAQGFKRAELTSTDIGSYFWITQNVQPASPRTLVARIDLRLDVLEPWLAPEPLADARVLLSQIGDDPKKFRELARLDFRKEVAEAFDSPACREDAHRREYEGWTNGFMDEVADQLTLIVDSRAPGRTTLGQLLLVNTAWSGGIDLGL